MSYEKNFEYDLNITGVTDYGADMKSPSTGRETVPLQGLSSMSRSQDPSKAA